MVNMEYNLETLPPILLMLVYYLHYKKISLDNPLPTQQHIMSYLIQHSNTQKPNQQEMIFQFPLLQLKLKHFTKMNLLSLILDILLLHYLRIIQQVQ
jgi:hypothetical protein